MTKESTLTTRTIGEAESALSELLTRTLSGSGLDNLGWIALRLVATRPSPTPLTALEEQLKHSRKVDAGTFGAILDNLENLHILQNIEDNISTTTEGAKLFERLSGEIGRLTDQAWESLDLDDLATTHRVLTTVTARINALLG